VGRFALARLLLQVLRTLRQLDRKLLLLFALSSLPACIIPVGPEFQDPPGSPNAPPQIIEADPTWGADVTGTSSARFSITVVDVNGDDLFIRWIVDGHPKESSRPQISHDELNRTVEKTVTCSQDIDDKVASRHFIRGVVADREFLTDTADLLAVTPPGLRDLATWTLNMTCPASPQ